MNTVSTYVNRGPGRSLSALILTILAWLFVSGIANAQTYSGPLVITKGGTYTGNWESRDSEVAAVEVRTTEPVIIVNSNIRGAGYLIKSWGHSANITVRHTNGYGLTPTPWRDYKKPRRFLTVNNFKNVVVENCYMESTAGIYIGTRYEGNGSESNTVKIRYNKAKNIDGRVHGGAEHSQFTQFNFRGNLPHAEIAWNEIINEPNNSLVEDNINMHNSRGTSTSPIRIHNNYVQGAYPIPATGTSYSGGGIITDGDGDINSCPSFIHANDNHLVNLGNYSMGIAGGNNIRYTKNRAVNSATFDNGSRFSMYTSGFWSKDYYKKNTTFNNSVDNNYVGIMAWGWTNNRNDINVQEATSFTNNTSIAGTVTKQMEKDEYNIWLGKLQKNSIQLGPNGSAPATSPTPTAPTAPTAPVDEAPVASAPVNSTPTTGTGSSATGTGKITRDLWRNIHGTNVSAIPVTTAPASTSELNSFEAPGGQGNNYGQRIRGYVTAPVSGQYTFWIAADDMAELYLSTSENPAGKTRIAASNTWTNSREWTKTAGQQSAKITLEAGKRYYIEALMLQGGGGDNLAVGWQLPNGTMERPIAGNRLSPMELSLTASASMEADTQDTNIAFDQVAAYPNPFNDVVTLNMGNEKTALQEVVILDQTGTVVYKEGNLKLENNKLVMHLGTANLRAGLYFLKYTDTTGKSNTIKLIKE